MSNVTKYNANTIAVIFKTTDLVLSLYENAQERETQIKLKELDVSMKKVEVVGAVLTSFIQAVSAYKELKLKLESYKTHADNLYRQQKLKHEFFLLTTKPIIDQCKQLMDNGFIQLDTSALNEIDRQAAINFRNQYLDMQKRYMDILSKMF